MPLIELMFTRGIIEDHSFSIYLTPQNLGGMLFIGGYDPAYKEGDFHYYNLISETYYIFEVSELLFDNVIHVHGNATAIVDSGTTAIAVPVKVSNLIWSIA